MFAADNLSIYLPYAKLMKGVTFFQEQSYEND